METSGKSGPEELKVDEEMPIMINDYMYTNEWEKLTAHIEGKLMLWNLASARNRPEGDRPLRDSCVHPPRDEEAFRSCDLIYGTSVAEISVGSQKLRLLYVSLPRCSEEADSHLRPYAKYYSQEHVDMFQSSRFEKHSPEQTWIPQYFGVRRFVCICIADTSVFSLVDSQFAKTVLGALQIAAQQA